MVVFTLSRKWYVSRDEQRKAADGVETKQEQETGATYCPPPLPAQLDKVKKQGGGGRLMRRISTMVLRRGSMAPPKRMNTDLM